ncbi:hypothetical protein G9A89_021967 [Geosiphon pyriformis]|nr:hypothetical protein G9A89_021967 [Geosiphon pyriformis]
MEATQYQALIGNDWLFKVNTPPREKLLIELEEEKKKPIWEAYQVFWANADHNELPPILSWNDNPKGKQKEELTWETDDLIWTDNEQEEPLSWEGRKKTLKSTTLISHTPTMATKFYCHACHVECFGRPKQVGKWDNIPCIVCGETLLNEGMWNDIPGRGEMCDVFCQYTIFISNWQMAIAKIEGVLPEKIRTIKNNPPKPIKLDWDTEPVINFLEPEELCYHCLIPSDFEYCDDCDLIYNPPPCIIYTIPEEEKPISSCASESESLINRDPDSDDNNKNTGSSSVQNGNDNKDNSNSDSNSDLNYEQYIAIPDLSKKQELK